MKAKLVLVFVLYILAFYLANGLDEEAKSSHHQKLDLTKTKDVLFGILKDAEKISPIVKRSNQKILNCAYVCK